MKRTTVVFLCMLMLLAALSGCRAAASEIGYVRLAIKGTSVNLRPQPRAAGQVVAQMNTGDVFFAEKWPITLEDDNTQWYKIVLPAPDSGRIEPLCDWDSRFTANVAFVRSDFATVSPLKQGDVERILATPVGRGYSVGTDELEAMKRAGLIPFSPFYSAKERVEIFGDNPQMADASIVGYYERGGVRVTGMEADGKYYTVMDPGFRKPGGYVKAADISVEPYEIKRWDNDFNWGGFEATCRLTVGANLPEIVRKWGEAEIERSAFEFLESYVIYTSVEQPDFEATFYEYLPESGDAPDSSRAIPYLQTFDISRKGASIGGIRIGRDDEDSVKKLLGEPHSKGRDDGENFWNWNAEFNDLWVRFDGNGLVSGVSFQWRAAD